MYKKRPTGLRTRLLRKQIARQTKDNNKYKNNSKKLNSSNERKIFSSKERKEVLDLYGITCYLCQTIINLNVEWHIDHVQPISKGGSNDIENLRPTHKICNELKSDKSINLVKLGEAHKKHQDAKDKRRAKIC